MFDQTNEIQEIMSRTYDMPGDINEADLEQGVIFYLIHSLIFGIE